MTDQTGEKKAEQRLRELLQAAYRAAPGSKGVGRLSNTGSQLYVAGEHIPDDAVVEFYGKPTDASVYVGDKHGLRISVRVKPQGISAVRRRIDSHARI